MQKSIKKDKIEVRWFLWSNFDYFDAHQERSLTIAEANAQIDDFGNFKNTRIGSRKSNEPTITYIREITHMDISPKQIMSVETSLIPFLEHDDATRAEMGSNMMRLAVP